MRAGVYIIRLAHAPEYIKVGEGLHLLNRISQVSGSQPIPPRLVWATHTQTKEDARLLEYQIQNFMWNIRLAPRRDWFQTRRTNIWILNRVQKVLNNLGIETEPLSDEDRYHLRAAGNL